MKLDIKKQTHTLYTIITQAYHSRCSSWKLSSKARIAWETFQPASRKVKNENDVIRNRISNFDKRRISQPEIQYTNQPSITAMNNRKLLIAAVFHFMYSVEKDSKKHHKLTIRLCQLQLSKQTSFKMLYINFLPEPPVKFWPIRA